MQIVCPVCNAQYKIASGKIPEKSVQSSCKKCGGKILIDPRVGQDMILDAQIAAVSVSQTAPEGESKYSPTSARDRTASELSLISEYPELQDLDSEKLDLEEIFASGKNGTHKTRNNKFKLRILRAVHETLDKMLLSDEVVMRIGKATAVYPIEMIFGNGYLTMMYNHYAVVGTNQRLLFINVNPKISRPTHYYSQIPYGSIKKIKKGLFGTSLVIHRQKGKKRTFTGMKRYLVKEFQQFIRERQQPGQTARLNTMVEDLCPSCFMPLAKNLLTCPKCKAPFKKPATAFFRSLLLPGWGDIYLGHRLLGTLELLGSVAVWAVIITIILGGNPDGLILAALLLVFYNGFDGLLTRHMARKGYMLASK
jgi:predicted Zn finger-like uncharacterized protein